jgi:hypothetical protein
MRRLPQGEVECLHLETGKDSAVVLFTDEAKAVAHISNLHDAGWETWLLDGPSELERFVCEAKKTGVTQVIVNPIVTADGIKYLRVPI